MTSVHQNNGSTKKPSKTIRTIWQIDMNASKILRPHLSKYIALTTVPIMAPTASNDTTKEPSDTVSGPEGRGVVSCVSTMKFGPHQPHAAPAANVTKLPVMTQTNARNQVELCLPNRTGSVSNKIIFVH